MQALNTPPSCAVLMRSARLEYRSEREIELHTVVVIFPCSPWETYVNAHWSTHQQYPKSEAEVGIIVRWIPIPFSAVDIADIVEYGKSYGIE